jgi:hypothetical protein
LERRTAFYEVPVSNASRMCKLTRIFAVPGLSSGYGRLKSPKETLNEGAAVAA